MYVLKTDIKMCCNAPGDGDVPMRGFPMSFLLICICVCLPQIVADVCASRSYVIIINCQCAYVSYIIYADVCIYLYECTLEIYDAFLVLL